MSRWTQAFADTTQTHSEATQSQFSPNQAASSSTAPYYYVLDEPKILGDHTRHALESLLIEHDRLTGQQFIIAIFQSSQGKNTADWTHQLFNQWKMAEHGQGDGILLTVFWNERKTQMEIGYGLDSVMTGPKIQETLSQYIIPELNNNQPAHALIAGVRHVLEILDSPLLESGKAAEILQTDGIDPKLTRVPSASTTKVWYYFFISGIIFFVLAISQILSREAHFTRDGWFRVSPWYWNKEFLSTHRRLSYDSSEIGGTSGHW